MKHLVLVLLVVLTTTPAHSGPACDSLAASVQSCTQLPVGLMSACIRAQHTLPCQNAEGSEALGNAMRPGWEAYLAARIAEHKAIYGQ